MLRHPPTRLVLSSPVVSASHLRRALSTSRLTRSAGTVMQLFIARENIRRFKQQLQSCTDPVQRATLADLIATEEAKLRLLESKNPIAEPCSNLRVDG